ncbi:MAG: hypothetical protein QG604_641 [Candidatus Dependentiae bacterium]|nr:hypothetical protein [Candidatus Dependentiae bacterium]
MNGLLWALMIGVMGVLGGEARGDGLTFPTPPSLATGDSAVSGSKPADAAVTPTPAVTPSPSPTSSTPLPPPPTIVAPPSASTPPVTSTSAPAAPATPAPTPAPAAAAAPVPEVPPVKVQELEAKPLFTSAPAVAGAISQKEMYEKSEAEESKAQTALSAIEQLKSTRLDTYLSFDAELDGVYDASGLTRGDVSESISEAKDQIALDLSNKKATNHTEGSLVTEQSVLLDKLDHEMKTLHGKEAAVISAIKVLSDYILELGDSVVQISTQRGEINSALDPAAATDIFNKIKQTAEKVTAAQTAIVGSTGQAKAVDDAIGDAKKQIDVVKKIVDDLKKKNVNLADVMKKVSAPKAGEVIAAPKPIVVDAAAVSPDDASKKKTKQFRKKPDFGKNLVSGSVFEGPYELIAGTLGSVRDALAPVTNFMMCTGTALYAYAMHMCGASDGAQVPEERIEAVLDDPVLERIRVERNQSYEKVQALAEQRELIEMKEALLDRLEAERVMQLDTKEKIKEETLRAYDRKHRELSWFDLFKRFVWKLYAASRRLVGRTVAWWRGEKYGVRVREKSTVGRGIAKQEPEVAAQASTSVPAAKATILSPTMPIAPVAGLPAAALVKK